MLKSIIKYGVIGYFLYGKRDPRDRERQLRKKEFQEKLRLATDPAYAQAQQSKAQQLQAAIVQTSSQECREQLGQNLREELRKTIAPGITLSEWITEIGKFFNSRVEHRFSQILELVQDPEGYDVIAAHYYTFLATKLGNSPVRFRVSMKGKCSPLKFSPAQYDFVSGSPRIVLDPRNSAELLETLTQSDFANAQKISDLVANLAQKHY